MTHVSAKPSRVEEYANTELFRELDAEGFVERAHGYLIAHFPTLQPEDRQDLIQDSYIRLLGRARKCAPLEVNATYQLKVVRTAAIDFFRAAQRTQARFVDFDPQTNDLVEMADTAVWRRREPSVEEMAQQLERVSLVRERIGLMPPRRREVMRLDGYGNTYREIGAVLSISPNTVRNHLRVGRQELRRSLPMDV